MVILIDIPHIFEKKNFFFFLTRFFYLRFTKSESHFHSNIRFLYSKKAPLLLANGYSPTSKGTFFLIKISSVFYTKNKPIVSSLLLMPPAHVMVEIDISFSLSLSSCYRSLRSCIDERQSSRSTFRTPSNIKNRTC